MSTGSPVGEPFVPSLCQRGIAFAIALAAGVWLLDGCGGGGGGGGESSAGSASSPSPTRPGPNRAPTISGSPARAIAVGMRYSFAPFASDVDGDALIFGIKGKPAWASFDSATGKLSGSPTSADVGSTSHIEISVWDGAATVTLPAFEVRVMAVGAGSVSLSWTPPTLNLDGSPLIDLAGYNIYWGTSEGDYPNSVVITNPGLAAYVVDNLAPANWYFVMTAVTVNGLESSYSNITMRSVL